MGRAVGTIEYAGLVTAVDQAADGVLITDTNGNIQYLNPAFTAMTGYTCDEIVGRNPRFLKSGVQTAAFYQELWSTIRSGRVWHGDLTNRRKDGTSYCEEMRIAPIQNPNGVVTGYIAIKQDVTQQRAIQESLREAREFAQSTIDALASHLCVLNEVGTIISVNQAWNDFALANCNAQGDNVELDGGGLQNRFSIGVNYLEACDRAVGPEATEAAEFAAGIRSVLHGDCAGYSMEYSCNSPREQRWFIGKVTRFLSNRVVRIIVEHINVTEYRRTQERLRESEERFRTMADSSPSFMWVTGSDGEVQFINQAYQKFSGTTCEELQSGRWNLLLHPDDATAHIESFCRAVKGQASFSAEARFRRADGQWRLLGSKAEPRISPAGEYLGMVGLSADITERRQSEQALQVSEEKFRQIAENIKEVFWMMNAAGTEMVYISPAYERVWGRSCASLYESPMDWLEAVHPDDRESARATFQRKLEGERIDSEYRIETPDGQEKWIRDRAFPIRDPNGKLIRIAGIAEEFTERKIAEQALRNSEEKFRQLAENIRDVFRIVPIASNETLYVSPAYEQVWNRSMESIYQDSQAWLEAVHPEDREKAEQVTVRQLRGEQVDVEYRIQTPDGQEKWIRDRAFPVCDQHGQLIRVVGIAEEITAQKRYQSKLIRLRQEADAANLAKSRFLANMSHEIRTPMNGVIGMNQLLLETDLTTEQRRYVEVVQSSGRTLLALIDDILDLSKVESGRLILEKRDFRLNHAVNEVVQLLRVQARAKGLYLASRISSKIPELLHGDAHRLRQVLTNLIANAIKFTERGEITLDAQLRSQGDNTTSVLFTVTDTGIGIREQQIPSLFSPFAQADASTTRRYGGSGLGLAISKQLVEMMGGSIGVNSREGQGSTFWFTATFGQVILDPCQFAPQSATPPRQNTMDSALDPIPRGHGERILIAEDNLTNREVILAQLKKLGYKAGVAANGVEALDAVEHGSFDLVLMDCQMPLMDGYEATSRIRHSTHPHIPIVALTASAMSRDRERCLTAGMDDYLAKPIELPRLAAVLAQWIPPSRPGKSLPILQHSSDRKVAVTFHAESLLRRLMGDQELASAVLKGFLGDTPPQLKQLCARIDESDAPGTRLQAHALKGAAATVGAEALHHLCEAIEIDAAKARLDHCTDLLIRAVDEFERFKLTAEHVERNGWTLTTIDNPGIEEINDVRTQT